MNLPVPWNSLVLLRMSASHSFVLLDPADRECPLYDMSGFLKPDRRSCDSKNWLKNFQLRKGHLLLAKWIKHELKSKLLSESYQGDGEMIVVCPWKELAFILRLFIIGILLLQHLKRTWLFGFSKWEWWKNYESRYFIKIKMLNSV